MAKGGGTNVFGGTRRRMRGVTADRTWDALQRIRGRVRKLGTQYARVKPGTANAGQRYARLDRRGQVYARAERRVMRLRTETIYGRARTA